jgi:hypothetical protein
VREKQFEERTIERDQSCANFKAFETFLQKYLSRFCVLAKSLVKVSRSSKENRNDQEERKRENELNDF